MNTAPAWVDHDFGGAPEWRVHHFLNSAWGQPENIVAGCRAFAATYGDVALMNGLRDALRGPTPHGVTFNRGLVRLMLARVEAAYWAERERQERDQSAFWADRTAA